MPKRKTNPLDLVSQDSSTSSNELVARGLNNFLEGLSTQLPTLTDEDRSLLANSLLNEMGDRLKNHERIAFVKGTSDGDTHLYILDIRSANKRK